MPDRILRDYTDSEKFDGFSGSPETLFTRLLMKVDDYGRFSRDPVNVRGACYPRAENLRANTVDAWLHELSDHRLILCYQVGGKPFLAIINFRQRLRDPKQKPKCPPPPDKDLYFRPDDGDWQAEIRNPQQISNPPPVAAISGGLPPYSYSQSSAKSESESQNKIDVLEASSGGSKGGGEKTVTMPLIGVVVARIVSNADNWHYDNSKVDKAKLQPGSLKTVLLKLITDGHKFTESQACSAWNTAALAAHQAVVDKMPISTTPEAYACGIWALEIKKLNRAA